MMFNINDLQSAKGQPDQLEKFQNLWVTVLDSMDKYPDEETLKHPYYKQVTGMKLLSEDINHYNRKDIEHPDRTYQFLFDCVERQLRVRRQELNRLAFSSSLNAIAAPAVPNVTPETQVFRDSRHLWLRLTSHCTTQQKNNRTDK